MRKSILLFVIASALLTFCSQKKSDRSVMRFAFKENELDSAYASIRPAVQTFIIDNRKINKIKAANGTEVLIPAKCFLTAGGGEVENVQIEVVEAFSLHEFVTAGLTTLSNGKLLLSNGILYINAKAGEETLQLKPGSPLTVVMPTMSNNEGYQLFKGDGRNWTVDSSMAATDYAMTLPLDLLYPEGNNTFWYCITDVGGKGEKTHRLDTTILDVTNRKYENTILATEEFKKRIVPLMDMMEHMSYFTNSDYYFDKVDCEGQKFNYDIWRVYFEHPERSFKEADSLAKELYLDYYRANREKIAAFCERVNRHKRTYYSNWSDTTYYFDYRKVSLEEDFMSPLKYFPLADKEILVINDRGIDLNASNAFEQLSAKGVLPQEINQILSYHFRRGAVIRELQKVKDALVNKANLSQIYQSTVFSVSEMGWINCDRFYDDPAAGKAAIFVSNSSSNHLGFIDCSLVIPELNVRLSAYPDGAGKWSFTKKEGPYTRLPLGKDAVIVGVSLQHDSVFFACQKVKIQDGLSVALPMNYIKKTDLKDSLVVALKR